MVGAHRRPSGIAEIRIAIRHRFLSTLPTMPTRISIPLELQEQVIDSLTNDKSALQQCALTCRAWVPRARLQLFRNITLRTRHDAARIAYALAEAGTSNIAPRKAVRPASHCRSETLRDTRGRRLQPVNDVCMESECRLDK